MITEKQKEFMNTVWTSEGKEVFVDGSSLGTVKETRLKYGNIAIQLKTDKDYFITVVAEDLGVVTFS